MKSRYLCIFGVIFLLINWQISIQFKNGFLGPNADTSYLVPTKALSDISKLINSDDVILFDDNTYNSLKHYQNKKMPITYFKLYNDIIPDIVSSNLGSNRGVTLTNCAFINELNLYRHSLHVSIVESYSYKNFNLCLSILTH